LHIFDDTGKLNLLKGDTNEMDFSFFFSYKSIRSKGFYTIVVTFHYGFEFGKIFVIEIDSHRQGCRESPKLSYLTLCFKFVINPSGPQIHFRFIFLEMSLKMAKCEIFDRSDFDDFYTIKSLWGADFRIKIKVFFLYLEVHLGPHNLPPVLLIPVVHLDLRISPRIFEKIRNGPNGIPTLGLGGGTDS
jgi:hypothetical protein